MNLRNGLWTLCWISLGSALWVGFSSQAAEPFFESCGARVGGSFTSNAHDFHQTEAFANFKLPYEWTLERDWQLQSRLDLSVGWLSEPGTDAAVGTMGASLLLWKPGMPVSFEAGLSPTLLSRYAFGAKNFGIPFQFTSHLGVNFELPAHARLGYRFQHMSNGGLDPHNPGLNLHMFVLSYRF